MTPDPPSSPPLTLRLHAGDNVVIARSELSPGCGRRVFDLILRVASGEKSKSEALGFGEAEFAPWPLGAVM